MSLINSEVIETSIPHFAGGIVNRVRVGLPAVERMFNGLIAGEIFLLYLNLLQPRELPKVEGLVEARDFRLAIRLGTFTRGKNSGIGLELSESKGEKTDFYLFPEYFERVDGETPNRVMKGDAEDLKGMARFLRGQYKKN